MAHAAMMTDTVGMELLEREASLAVLAGYATEARHGDGRLVVLGGEAGVGKTALLEWFQRDLPDARWSWGACDGLFTPRPLGPLYDLADQLGGELLDLCDRGANRDELFRALLRQVSGPGPLNVVVVEDVHWTDEATMDLLRLAGRRLREARVLLVVTFRDDDLATNDQLRVALGELARQRSTRRISLTALSAGAVQELASGSDLKAAALASHREAVAQFERALRFAAGASGFQSVAVAGLYDELAAELTLLDRAEQAAEACKHALELWRAAGDRLREGDTTRRLSCALWHLCRGEEAGAAAAAAVALLEPLPPGIELAQAYAELASRSMVLGRHEAAIENARRAQSIAEQAGAPAVISDALNTEAISASVLSREWAGLMDRALRIALAGDLPAAAGRAYCNYYATLCAAKRFAEAEPLYVDGIAYCDDHDIVTYGTFLRSERTGMLEKTGRWDEALALSLDILDRAAPAPVTRLCPTTRVGALMARRGEDSAWEYLDQAMADADQTGEPQSIVPVRLARAEACWLEGRAADAVIEAERADEAANTDDGWTYGAVAAWLRRTESSRRPRGQVAEPYRHELNGHWEKAAQLWTTWAARTRPRWSG
jgi:tetratricopeptide (TPR) repeat protein